MAAILPVDSTFYLVIVAPLEGSKRTSQITFYINKRPQGFLYVLVAAVPAICALISIGTATDGSLMCLAGGASSLQLSTPQLSLPGWHRPDVSILGLCGINGKILGSIIDTLSGN
ncbi:hypothetical protein I7I51_08621 [Histoplasma capsulatum]|uniref:Uncharacterized protein n=1 Tax=Ajellomyces capsulatus TaxID=5037 RepID=A0A8A1LZ92_AJECA|nr:hypothetical protein I7I51_08621 [Histoplasma capsulatum]